MHDAISNAIRDEISWLQGAGHEVRLYAYKCDHSELPFVYVERESDIAFDPYFQSCDLVIFHFGIYYPLFNLLPVVPVGAKKLVIFHNITPKEFLPPSAHAVIDRSFGQVSNIAFADHVICDSETNRKILLDAEIQVPSTVLPLSVHSNLRPPARKPSFDDGVLRLVFLGRLVKSKGPIDLLMAVAKVLEAHVTWRMRLDLVGNLHFSDGNVVADVNERLNLMQQKYGVRLLTKFHANASEDEKCRILSEADIFVLPTYHEGFCVPILEAFASGCRVIAYENSNTPAISGGLATLVPTGDVGLLAEAIAAAAAASRSLEWRADGGGYASQSAAAMKYTRNFSPEVIKKRYLGFIEKQVENV